MVIFLAREYLSQLLELRKNLFFSLFTSVSILCHYSLVCQYCVNIHQWVNIVSYFLVVTFLENFIFLFFQSSFLSIYIYLHRTGKMAQWSSSCLVKTTHRIIFSLLIPLFFCPFTGLYSTSPKQQQQQQPQNFLSQTVQSQHQSAPEFFQQDSATSIGHSVVRDLNR